MSRRESGRSRRASGPRGGIGGGGAELPGVNIVFHGNSITRGANSSNDATLSWVALTSADVTLQLAAELSLTCTRKGFDGFSTEQLTANFDAEVDALRASTGRNIVVFSEGGNDILFGASEATAETNITAYVDQAQAAGWEVLVATIPPRVVPGHWSAGAQAIANAVNVWIRANGMGADGFLEMADTDLLPFLTDGVHPNDAGHAFLAPQGTKPLRHYISPDVVAPTVVSIASNTSGTKITLTASEALDESSVPAVAQLTLGGTDATVRDIAIDGPVVTIGLYGNIKTGEAVTLTYAVPVSDPFRDDRFDPNNLAAFAQSVTNNSTYAVTYDPVASDAPVSWISAGASPIVAGVIQDLSGNGNHFTINGSITFETESAANGQYGMRLTANGTDNAACTTLNINRPDTIYSVLRLPSTLSPDPDDTFFDGGTGFGQMVAILNSGGIQLFHYSGSFDVLLNNAALAAIVGKPIIIRIYAGSPSNGQARLVYRDASEVLVDTTVALTGSSNFPGVQLLNQNTDNRGCEKGRVLEFMHKTSDYRASEAGLITYLRDRYGI